MRDARDEDEFGQRPEEHEFRCDPAMGSAVQQDVIIPQHQAADDALRIAEERFRNAFEESPIGMAITDIATLHPIRVNRSLCEVLGYPEEFLLATPASQITHPEDWPNDFQLRQQLLAGEIRSFQIEKRLHHASGSWIWMLLTVCLIQDSHSRKRYYLAQFQDISKRKQAQQYQSLQFAVTRVLAESSSMQLAMPALLEAVCRELQWEAGDVWAMDSQNQLKLQAFWAVPSIDLKTFLKASQDCIFPVGVGLPGRIAGAGTPLWIPDVTQKPWFLRAAVAAQSGLHGACGVPIRVDNRISGVMAFYGKEIRQPDEELLGVMEDIGRQIGQFVDSRRLSERYKLLFERNLAGVYLTAFDGTIVDCNEACAKIFGYSSRNEMMQTRSWDIYYDPEDRKRLLDEIRALPSLSNREVRLKRKDGSPVWVLGNAVLVSSAQDPTLIQGTIIDITEIKMAEHKRLELQAQVEKSAVEWRLTFDAIDDPIVIADSDLRITRVNRAVQTLTGKSYDKLVGRQLSGFGASELGKALVEIATIAREGKSTVSQICEQEPGRMWDISAFTFKEQPTSEPMIILVLHDLKDLVQLQEPLRRSETMSAIGALVAGIAHEVRNPLFSIGATLDAYEDSFTVEQKEAVAALRNELDRLNQLTRQLSDYGNPEKAELTLAPLATVMREAAHLSGSTAARCSVTLRLDIAPHLPEIPMDRERLIVVFQNLIVNAIEHSPAGSVVMITANAEMHASRNSVVCRVEDSGPGFRPDDLEHVLLPFYKRRHGGAGLGLAIVHRIVREHAAQISLQNREQGGAQIEIVFTVGAMKAKGKAN